MGCDIHCFVEKREGGKWVFDQEFELNRNYQLFYFICGVRAETVKSRGDDTQAPIHPEPLGFAPDMSPNVREHMEWSDMHSITYFEGEDLKKFEALFEKGLEQYVNDVYTYWAEIPGLDKREAFKLPEGEYRVIVGFDN